MQKQKKQALAVVFAALFVLIWSAFAPQSPRAAWWCTAFSVTCEETAAGTMQPGEKPVFRSLLADLLLHKDNT